MGIMIAIANAFANSFQNTLIKQAQGLPVSFVNWWRFLGGTIVLVFIITVRGEWQWPPSVLFAIVLGASLPLELLQSYFYVRAFQNGPQSVMGPLFGSSQLFLLPLGAGILNEFPSAPGVLGVLLTLAGPFFLGERIGNVRSVFVYRGSASMILAALFSALLIVISKYSFRYASPLLFAFFHHCRSSARSLFTHLLL